MDKNDWPQLYELDQDPAVMQYLTRGVPSSLDQIKSRSVPQMLTYRNAEKGWGLWQITKKTKQCFYRMDSSQADAFF
ncbi:hypothetical protein PTRA_a2567 [Pseudoalteromonas translucida KMM 520]|uniref:Uncharacterized protein n=1 Tax=Pseudoalteromonas translucida KMM 520 TaxID=1315283 RepID=A0A0U2WP66_9GAMM|nr:hypothetical protein PTRA_a2567 [Pseudoalteromonas translucida KMM 520]